MQVGVDVTCMHIKFGGRDLSGFEDISTFKNNKISLSTHGLQSMVIKKFKQSELAQKIMQVFVDVTYMHTNFSGQELSSFGDFATFKNSQISLLTHGL